MEKKTWCQERRKTGEEGEENEERGVRSGEGKEGSYKPTFTKLIWNFIESVSKEIYDFFFFFFSNSLNLVHDFVS